MKGYGHEAIFSQGDVHHMEGNVGIGTQQSKEALEGQWGAQDRIPWQCRCLRRHPSLERQIIETAGL